MIYMLTFLAENHLYNFYSCTYFTRTNRALKAHHFYLLLLIYITWLVNIVCYVTTFTELQTFSNFMPIFQQYTNDLSMPYFFFKELFCSSVKL